MGERLRRLFKYERGLERPKGLLQVLGQRDGRGRPRWHPGHRSKSHSAGRINRTRPSAGLTDQEDGGAAVETGKDAEAKPARRRFRSKGFHRRQLGSFGQIQAVAGEQGHKCPQWRGPLPQTPHALVLAFQSVLFTLLLHLNSASSYVSVRNWAGGLAFGCDLTLVWAESSLAVAGLHLTRGR